MDKKTEKLEHLEKKVLLFGGIYSNLQALEKLIQISEKEGIPSENCICTGDIIGYCAQPEKTIQLFKKWGAKSIAGNVEIQLRNGADDCGCDFTKGSRCDSFSEQWYPFAKSKLSADSLAFLKTLPDHLQCDFGSKKITVVHGSYFNVSEFIFKSTPWETKYTNFIATNSNIIIAGHSGLPFQEKQNELWWINPGVIGMPANDGQPQVWYAILENKNDTILCTFKSFIYNHKLTNQRMKKEQLPEAYANSILTGLWDNMEILPESEKKLQGKKIRL